MENLDLWANLSAILTATIAVIGYGKYRLDQRKRRKTLEEYLKNEKLTGFKCSNGDKGQRSILNLIAKLGMTEEEILQASFQSKYIERKMISNGSTGLAANLLLEYQDKSANSYPKEWREGMKKLENS